MVIEFDGFVTVREAARECQRSPETIRRWVWDGKLHAEKLGNQLFVKRSDLNVICKATAEQRRAKRTAALQQLDELRKRIHERGGGFDVLEALDRSRESHP